MSGLSHLVKWLEKAHKDAKSVPRALDAVVPNVVAKAAPRGVSVLSSRTEQGLRVELKKPSTVRPNPVVDQRLADRVADRISPVVKEALEKAVKGGLV